jgi:hypothetical protein
MDVECIARLMTVMTCPACIVPSFIGHVIRTAKALTAHWKENQEEEEEQHKHEHRMIFCPHDAEGPQLQAQGAAQAGHVE